MTSSREKKAVTKAVKRVMKEARMPPLAEDPKERDNELRRRSSKFYRTQLKTGRNNDDHEASR